LKVLHVIPTLAAQYGGPVTAILGMTAAQTKAGDQVKLLTTDYLSNGNRIESTCETKVFHCKFDPWQWSPSLGDAVRKEVGWADIVNIHTMWSYPVAVAARACWAAGVPYVLRPAGMLDRWSMSQKQLKKQIYTTLIERRTISRAKVLWFTSEEERAGASGFDQEGRGVVIPLGIVQDEFLNLPPKGSFRESFLDADKRRIILFLGRVTPKKQPDIALKAFAEVASEFADTVLVIAGAVEDAYLSALQKEAEKLKISARVYFTGALGKHDVVAALNDAAVFVLPSLHENFGVAVIEAMAAGTPVIVSDRVGLASVINEAEAGIVIEATQDSLTAGLIRILGDPADAEAMGKRGRQEALERFTWDRIVPVLRDTYLQAIEGKEASAALVRPKLPGK
jgi:glycosyltransferase involved in cell wall biosynthesis